jgi:single-strand DNA-binding protein
MANFNKVILAGNLTRDPQLSYTQGGTAVCQFGLAVNRRWRDQAGNQQEETCFVDLTAFGRQAEVINQYMTKGRSILIDGRLNFSQWTTPEGDKRSKLKVVVESFQFLGGPGGGDAEGGSNRGGGAQRGASRGGPVPANADAIPPEGDDIPF